METAVAERFAVGPWTIEGEEVRFGFSCSHYGGFVESLRFPGCASGLSGLTAGQRALLDILSAALGVSYYKARASGHLDAPALTPAGLSLVRALFTEGLGEFYVRNRLPYPPALEITAPSVPAQPNQQSRATAKNAVVAFGGGMDSHVALGLVERAGAATQLASVVLSDKVAHVIAECTDRQVYFIERRLDPRLLTANKEGARNGHIPVTAIHSLILVFYASLTGADWVVLANERSADEATVHVDGHGVNHQFSKTFAAEQLIRDAVAEAIPGGPEYFSALRAVGELWIARELADLPDALARFRSCNRNFVFSDASRALSGVRWCGRCAKCVFTALMMAPFLKRNQAKEIFGSDILDNLENLPLADELAGYTDSKPWECVGTIDEVSAALAHLGADPEWADAAIVKALSMRVRERAGSAALSRRFSAALTERGPSFVPTALQAIIDQDPA